MAGSTLFMPVCDVSLSLISLILNLVDGERGRYVRGHGGGMNVVDDRHGFRPAGTEPWVNCGFIDKAKVLPLSILERQACYFMFSEPAVICHNIFLATEAMGIGGWMHCGFLSFEIMQAMGFRMADTGAFANPVGIGWRARRLLSAVLSNNERGGRHGGCPHVAQGSQRDITAAEPAGSAHDGGCGVP